MNENSRRWWKAVGVQSVKTVNLFGGNSTLTKNNYLLREQEGEWLWK